MKSMTREYAAHYLATSGKTADTETVLADINVATEAFERAFEGHGRCGCEHARRLDMALTTLAGGTAVVADAGRLAL